MSANFAELDRRSTPMGEISVRRRLEPVLQVDVWEVKLGDEHLMSSLFTTSEIALADLALAAVEASADLDVVVGGLGLGYTARAVLGDPRVRSLRVVEALDAVIDWTVDGILPASDQLTDDARCHLVHGDFFELVSKDGAFGPPVADDDPGRGPGPDRFHAIVVDIDHTPRHVLHPAHAPFYEPAGLARLAERLRPGGVFALWSDDPPDDDHLAATRAVFATCEAHVVTFANPHTGGTASNTVYVATTQT